MIAARPDQTTIENHQPQPHTTTPPHHRTREANRYVTEFSSRHNDREFDTINQMEEIVFGIEGILGFLRDIQRRFETAILLVHARKSGATRPGQALRGSSELHAWGDSNLYGRAAGLSGGISVTVQSLAWEAPWWKACRTDDGSTGAAMEPLRSTSTATVNW